MLGETVAPFRLFNPAMAVIPLDGPKLLNSATASEAGYRHVAAWLRDTEAKWAEYSNKRADGQPRMTLSARIDHMRNLSNQAGQPTPRVVYAAPGTRLCAARVLPSEALVEHGAY